MTDSPLLCPLLIFHLIMYSGSSFMPPFCDFDVQILPICIKLRFLVKYGPVTPPLCLPKTFPGIERI